MRLMPISKCRPGMRLARKIYSEEGLVLLAENIELTARMIKRLMNAGIPYVYIQDARVEDAVLPQIIRDETMREALKEIRSSFRMMMDRPDGRKGVTYPYISKSYQNVMSMVIEDLTAHKDAMIMLMNMGVVDQYLYQHSLNVCVYTTMLGIAEGYSRDELTILGMGAALHDIGKTRIPESILKKEGKLTSEEFELMKKHTEIGYRMLKDEPNISLITAHCAFQHHERLDGSGYPRGIKGDDIHDYAKWIGLVDSYDAMTTNRVYRPPMLPHQAIELLYAGTGTLYEQRMVEQFRDKVAIYPIGLTVRLNSGETGIVVDINSACPHRPIVRVIEDADGEPVQAPYEVDLSKRLTAMIVSVNDEPTEVPSASGL
ncbi:metal dependent phosphohydrolase [Paenibacillus curdlanolyticus YK9]|uniref:Metal dependent phosphohydrolase n=1 Tax=Paenibacillus curdlanolyticus YK9 TaxID=717606 RepID=E0IBW4_9BACL|nr:metal dependent phosphohydrolase [Paenibacillus curdlanolyticus YK9]